MKSILAKILVSVLFCTVALPVSALNWSWAKDSPASHFTEEDWRLAKDAARTALNDTADGTTINWENKDSGASGSSTPLKSGTKDGLKCRYMKIQNSAKSIVGETIFLFCQQPDGLWKVKSIKK